MLCRGKAWSGGDIIWLKISQLWTKKLFLTLCEETVLNIYYEIGHCSLKYDELTAEKMQCDDVIKVQANTIQQLRCDG